MAGSCSQSPPLRESKRRHSETKGERGKREGRAVKCGCGEESCFLARKFVFFAFALFYPFYSFLFLLRGHGLLSTKMEDPVYLTKLLKITTLKTKWAGWAAL